MGDVLTLSIYRRNHVLNFGLFFETALAAGLCYSGLEGLRMYPLK